MNNKTALLVGASGMVGRFCLARLLASEHYTQVIVLARSSLGIEHAKLVEHLVDFEQLDEHKERFIAEDVFCCLGTTLKTAGSTAAFRKVDLDYPLAVATLAKSQGAKRMFLLTALSSTEKSMFFYNRVKGEVQRKIAELGFDTYHIFQPSMLLGKRRASDKRFGERFAQALFKVVDPLLVGSWRKYRGIEAQAVGEVMVKIAEQAPDGVCYIESDEIQQIFDLR